MNFIKRLFCNHKEIEFVSNIYGDMIIFCNYKRSVHKCKNCGKYIWKNELYKEKDRDVFFEIANKDLLDDKDLFFNKSEL